MLMQLKGEGDLVQIVDLQGLINPDETHVAGRLHRGELEPEPVGKLDLCFLSGEDLPRCWVDSHYRNYPGSVPAQMQVAPAPPGELKFSDTQVPSIY